MTIQPFFGTRTAAAWLVLACFCVGPALGDALPGNYPTIARVEYVNECIGANGGTLAALYQCSCAIDRIAARMSYEDFVEAPQHLRPVRRPAR